MPPATNTTTDKEGKKTAVINPEFTAWMAMDQQVLIVLLGTLTDDVLVDVLVAVIN